VGGEQPLGRGPQCPHGGARRELVENVAWELTQVRPRQRKAHLSIHGCILSDASTHPMRSPTPANEPADGGPQPVGQRSTASEDNRADPSVAVAIGPRARVSQRTPGLMEGGEPGGRVG
jgi:hypothetical protein